MTNHSLITLLSINFFLQIKKHWWCLRKSPQKQTKSNVIHCFFHTQKFCLFPPSFLFCLKQKIDLKPLLHPSFYGSKPRDQKMEGSVAKPVLQNVIDSPPFYFNFSLFGSSHSNEGMIFCVCQRLHANARSLCFC